MPPRDPGTVRASLLKGWFHHGPELFGAERFEAVRARVPADLEAQVTGAARTDWLPLGLLEAFDHVVWDCHGPDALRLAARGLSVRLGMSPLLQPFVSAVTTLFHLDPARAVARIPPAMAAMYRDCGTMTVSANEDRAVVVHEGCPPALTTPWLATANGGGMESVIAICRREGRSRIEADPARGRVVYTLEWTGERG